MRQSLVRKEMEMATPPTDLLREAWERYAMAARELCRGINPTAVEESLADIPALLDLAADRERLRLENRAAKTVIDSMREEIHSMGQMYLQQAARIAELERQLDDAVRHGRSVSEQNQQLIEANEDLEQQCDTKQSVIDAAVEIEEMLETSQRRVAELERQLRAACHVKADDVDGFDWAILGKMNDMEDRIAELERALQAQRQERDEAVELAGNLDKLLACYRIGKRPSDALLDRIAAIRARASQPAAKEGT